jgi:hypothetical protein
LHLLRGVADEKEVVGLGCCEFLGRRIGIAGAPPQQ